MIGTSLRIRYELIEELEDGPVFTSYRAKDKISGRDVRVRVLQPALAEDADFVGHLRLVADRLRGVNHPGLERLLECDDDPDEHVTFLVSEFVTGATLEDRIKRLAGFSVQVALTNAIGVCEALDELHRQGVIHGDVAARNVISGSGDTVKLAMGGMWEAYTHSARAAVASLRVMAPYMAPELSADAPPSHQSDIYAVGVLLYQSLTGRMPYAGDTPIAIATKHATAPFPSLRAVNSSVPVPLDELVRKCMAKSPAERYKDVHCLLRDLRVLQDSLRFGRPLTWPLSPDSGAVGPGPVAPEFNAVNPAPKNPRKAGQAQRARREPRPDGAPGWLWGLFWLTGLAVMAAGSAWIYFTLTKPKLVDTPNLVGMTVNEASAQLQAMRLRLHIARREPSDEYADGVVISTIPPPGRLNVRENAFVEAVVSAGSRFVEAPDLRGRSIDEAKSMLAKMNLELNPQVEYVRDRNVEDGLIVGQVPEPGRRIERMSRIRVRVSTGRQNAEVATGQTTIYNYNVRVTLPAGSIPIVLRVDMTDAQETKTIHDQEHAPGSVVDISSEGVGPEATFRIFFDGELRKQVTKRADDAPAAEDQPAPSRSEP